MRAEIIAQLHTTAAYRAAVAELNALQTIFSNDKAIKEFIHE